MLISYSSHMGSDTINRVKTSDVGVMIAASTRITTIA